MAIGFHNVILSWFKYQYTYSITNVQVSISYEVNLKLFWPTTTMSPDIQASYAGLSLFGFVYNLCDLEWSDHICRSWCVVQWTNLKGKKYPLFAEFHNCETGRALLSISVPNPFRSRRSVEGDWQLASSDIAGSVCLLPQPCSLNQYIWCTSFYKTGKCTGTVETCPLM